MNKTRDSKTVNVNERLLVTIDTLQELLSCGASTAISIAEESHACVIWGRRKLYSVEKIRGFIMQEAI